MKKTISILLTLTMLLAFAVPAFAVAFDDVGPAYDWARASIEKFSDEGVIEGKGDGKFAPEDNVTRAEFAKMLALTFGIAPSDKKSPYMDVPEEHWAKPYIMAVDTLTVPVWTLDETELSMSVVRYLPDQEATREEIAAALVNMYINITEQDNAGFVDILKENFSDSTDVNEKLYALITWAYELGFIKGYDDGTLRPQGNVTRAEAVVMLDRARTIMEQLPTPTPTVTPTATPTATPTSTPDETATPAPTGTPKASEDIISVVDVAVTSEDGQRYYAISYAVGGKIAELPLLVMEDATIGGQKSKLTEIECGDILLFSKHASGKVNSLFVLASPGEDGNWEDVNIRKLSVPSNLSWAIYGKEDKTNTIYYGKLTNWTEVKDGIGMDICGDAYILDVMSQKIESFYVPYDTKNVSVYNAYQNSYEKRFAPFDLHEARDLVYFDYNAYVFIHLKRDVVVDVIIIDYER